MCFGTAYDVLAGARARERTNLRCRTMSPGWRYGALVSHSKLAIRAYVDETKLYQLGIHNIQPEQRATGPLARSECDAPVLRAGPQYGSVPRSREHTAPPRSTPPLWRPRSTVGCSATITPALGSTAVQQSACREPTERVSRAPGRLSVSAGIARMGRDTQNR